MRTKKDEKFKLESVEELLGVVNEESAMDIEISKIQPFRAHNVLMQNYPSNQELVQGIFELILETVLYTGNKVIIASNEYPAEIVKNRFMKINYMHIQYVMECLRKNTTQVKNIKKYLLAALFNAPVTMQGYYQAEVNHAMPQFANNK